MRTAEQIAVMQASLEGKRIEWTRPRDPEWQPLEVTESYCWNWEDFIYRVAEPAPEPRRPREFWVNEFRGDSYSFAFRSEATARGMAGTVALDTLRLTEIPPGWRLVPPEAIPPEVRVGLPPLDGKFTDFDYWGYGQLDNNNAARMNVDAAAYCTTTGKWEAGFSRIIGYSHKAFRRNTALHAANFGEVAR